MSIALRSNDEIEAIARAGRVVWDTLNHLIERCRPGVSALELDHAARAMLKNLNAEASLGRVRNDAGDRFPGACCVNINDQIAHSAPSSRTLREGDLVSLDLAASLGGWCADACRTIAIGAIDPERARLMRAASACLERGLRACRAGRMWSHVAAEIRDEAAARDVRLIKGLGGHGVGRSLHERPLAWIDPEGADFTLAPGLMLTIEPAVTLGSGEITLDDDRWTLRTRDGRPAACEERTIAITPDGPRMLTGPLTGP